jgi:hypothetical protein
MIFFLIHDRRFFFFGGIPFLLLFFLWVVFVLFSAIHEKRAKWQKVDSMTDKTDELQNGERGLDELMNDTFLPSSHRHT